MSSATPLVIVGAFLVLRASAELHQLEGFGQEVGEQAHARIRRQLFGGLSHGPGGLRTQSVGYQAGPAWGSLSQTSNSRGFSSPITYSGGLGKYSAAGHGASARLDTQPGIGSHLNVRGQVGLVNTPKHQVIAWAQHDRNLNKKLKIVGRATNSAGLNFVNKKSGASVFLTGSHTPGSPDRGSIGGTIPLVNKGRTKLEATGQTDFGKGMKPQHQVGLQFTHEF